MINIDELSVCVQTSLRYSKALAPAMPGHDRRHARISPTPFSHAIKATMYNGTSSTLLDLRAVAEWLTSSPLEQ